MSIFELLYQHQGLFPLGQYWQFSDSQIRLSDGNTNYLTIESAKINLFGIDILSKLKSKETSSENNFDVYFRFINRIKNNIVKLNHLGFGYPVENVDTELTAYRNRLFGDFTIVEEKSDDMANNRWFFIKHQTNRLVIKVELVLYPTRKYHDYFPQFQLDIDTNLSYKSILEITNTLFGNNFFFWKYDIPNYGVIMVMGKIGQINGVKILLGVGTNLRKPQAFKK